MTAAESTKIIEAAGGNRKFAELIGIQDEQYYKQRIYNWKKRGIPSDVILANLDAIRRLSRKTNLS